MTERFEIFPQNVAKDGTLIIIQKGLKLYNISEVVELLNELHEENEQLKYNLSAHMVDLNNFKGKCSALEIENEQLKFQLDECQNHKLFSRRELEKENEQLKQRNDRQAKQLDRLYNLIEQKDWRTLTDILDDFKRCEEQLQREWRTYK